MCAYLLRSTLPFAAILLGASTAWGIAGFSQVAYPGDAVEESTGWIPGLVDVVNDPVRTVGWNFWFSECPNDINHYAFNVKSTDDLNRLIKKLAATKSKSISINLELAKEFPVRRFDFLKEGNGIGAVLAFGNQATINEWYLRLQEVEPGVRKFGVSRYVEPPKAMIPTLTIYLQHPAVDLANLNIPADIQVHALVSPEERKQRKEDAVLKRLDNYLEKRTRAAELR